MTHTMISIAGTETVDLAYPAWSMVPGGYVRRRSRRYHEAPVAGGVYIVGLAHAADVHELTLRYVPSRGAGGDWAVPLDALVALEGESVTLSWGDVPQPGDYILDRVDETYRDMVYAPDVGRRRGGWAPREVDVRLTLRGGEHAVIEGTEEDADETDDDLGG